MSNRRELQPEPLFIRATKGIADFARQTPAGHLIRGDFGGFARGMKEGLAQAFSDPTQVVTNFGPMGIAGITKPVTRKLGEQAIKQVDNLTKDEMIKAIDYIRLKKPFSQEIENSIAYLTEKFGISGRRLGVIANQLERLVENTKTKDISGRKLLFKTEKLKRN